MAEPTSLDAQPEYNDEGTITEFGIIIQDAKKATTKALTTFVQEEITRYKEEGQIGQDLWQAFREDFCDWDLQAFNRVSKPPLRQFRALLWDLGVWSPKDNTNVANHLINLLRQPYPEWPVDVPVPCDVTRRIQEQQTEEQAEDLTNINPIQTPDVQTPNIQTPNITTPKPNLLLQATQEEPSTASQEAIFTPQRDSLDFGNILSTYPEQTFSRELATLSKLYSDEMKYTGKNDAFDHKFKIFLTTCRNAGVPKQGLTAAFSLMLKEEAFNFYFANQSFFTSMSLQGLCDAFKTNFEGREHKISLLSEWNNTTLQTIINLNKEQTLTDCLDKMISKLRQLQHGLDKSLNTDSFIYNKLITACKDIPACEFACRKPAGSITGLISDLRASTALHDRRYPPKASDETMFTDRRYYSQNERNTTKRPNQSHGYSKDGPKDTPKKKCYVCGKPGCWSSNHNREEGSRSIRQHIVDIEGEQEDSKDEEAPSEDETELYRHLQISGTPLIERFMKTWSDNEALWQELTRAAHSLFEEALNDKRRLKCYIFSRTKERNSIIDSITRRERQRVDDRQPCFKSEEEILEAVPDLAGVRILQPFPNDVKEVKSFLQDQFGDERIKEIFWGLDENGKVVEKVNGRFVGYRATHFRVKWKLPSGEYSPACLTKLAHDGWTVEIQVTTMLMNSWQEIQHDLIYKELEGPPTQDEKDIAMTINGMAHSGEVALGLLERIQKDRIAKAERRFIYEGELAMWLREKDRADVFLAEIEINKIASASNNQKTTDLWRRICVFFSPILYEVLDVTGLNRPKLLRAILRESNPKTGASSELLLSYNKGVFSWDISLWAIIKTCVTVCEDDIDWHDDESMQAWALVNAMNLVLAGGSITSSVISNQVNKSPNLLNDIENYENALFSAVSESLLHFTRPDLVRSLWETLRDIPILSPFFRVSISMLRARILIVPKVNYDHYIGRLVIWPACWGGDRGESVLQSQLDPHVSIISVGEEKYKERDLIVGEFEWTVIRIKPDFLYNGGFRPEELYMVLRETTIP